MRKAMPKSRTNEGYMVALSELEDSIEGLDGLCEQALGTPIDRQLQARLCILLEGDGTPLQPTGLGRDLDHLLGLAANDAVAACLQLNQGSQSGFEVSILNLRLHLASVVGEIIRLKDG
jgi:hypothetical protein